MMRQTMHRELDGFPERLRRLRERKKISRLVAAELFGVTRSTLCRYEAGSREPKISTLIAMADYFDVSVDYLVGRKN